jgi:hypothetical protein
MSQRVWEDSKFPRSRNKLEDLGIASRSEDEWMEQNSWRVCGGKNKGALGSFRMGPGYSRCRHRRTPLSIITTSALNLYWSPCPALPTPRTQRTTSVVFHFSLCYSNCASGSRLAEYGFGAPASGAAVAGGVPAKGPMPVSSPIASTSLRSRYGRRARALSAPTAHHRCGGDART